MKVFCIFYPFIFIHVLFGLPQLSFSLQLQGQRLLLHLRLRQPLVLLHVILKGKVDKSLEGQQSHQLLFFQQSCTSSGKRLPSPPDLFRHSRPEIESRKQAFNPRISPSKSKFSQPSNIFLAQKTHASNICFAFCSL